jgi:ankyrin repeat protein
VVKLLLQRGADINAIDSGGYTPLHYASLNGADTSILLYLIHAGADIYVKNSNGKTIVDVARERNHFETASFLEGLMASNTKSANFIA